MRIRTTAMFKADDEQLVELGIVSDAENTQWRPYCFESSEICAINESKEGFTVIWFKSGDGIVIHVKYQDFEDVCFSPERILK